MEARTKNKIVLKTQKYNSIIEENNCNVVLLIHTLNKKSFGAEVPMCFNLPLFDINN